MTSDDNNDKQQRKEIITEHEVRLAIGELHGLARRRPNGNGRDAVIGAVEEYSNVSGRPWSVDETSIGLGVGGDGTNLKPTSDLGGAYSQARCVGRFVAAWMPGCLRLKVVSAWAPRPLWWWFRQNIFILQTHRTAPEQ